MDNSYIFREIILFEDEKKIFFDDMPNTILLTLNNHKNKKIIEYLHNFFTNESYYMRVTIHKTEIEFAVSNAHSKDKLKKKYNNELNVYINKHDYFIKVNYMDYWCFRIFSEDFNLENFKKIINLKKYINNKFINNFKTVKPDLFIKYC